MMQEQRANSEQDSSKFWDLEELSLVCGLAMHKLYIH